MCINTGIQGFMSKLEIRNFCRMVNIHLCIQLMLMGLLHSFWWTIVMFVFKSVTNYPSVFLNIFYCFCWQWGIAVAVTYMVLSGTTELLAQRWPFVVDRILKSKKQPWFVWKKIFMFPTVFVYLCLTFGKESAQKYVKSMAFPWMSGTFCKWAHHQKPINSALSL